MGASALRMQDVVRSGGFGISTNSARAGYRPVCFDHPPLQALEGIAIYLRQIIGPDEKDWRVTTTRKKVGLS